MVDARSWSHTLIQSLFRSQVAAGDSVSATLDSAGGVASWGKLSHAAMLGHSHASLLNARSPAQVDTLAGVHVAQISLGTQHAAAIVGIPRSL